MRLTSLASLALMFAVAPSAAAQGRGTQTTSTPPSTQPAQQVVVRQGPASTAAGADTLVQCVPVTTPTKREAVAKPVRRRPRVRPRPRPAAAAAPKPAPKPRPKVAVKPARKRPHVATHRTRPRTRPIASVASNAPARANLPALVMCRPIRPVAPMSVGPLPETVVPIPQIASVAPAAAPLPVEEVPSYIAAAGPHSRFLPLALIPAFFIPFIHSGHGSHGVDTTIVTPPPVDTTGTPIGPPPPPPPPTTVPEPSSLTLLASGLVALGGVAERRRRRQKRDKR